MSRAWRCEKSISPSSSFSGRKDGSHPERTVCQCVAKPGSRLGTSARPHLPAQRRSAHPPVHHKETARPGTGYRPGYPLRRGITRTEFGRLWAAIGRLCAALTAQFAAVHRTLTQRRSARRLRVSETLSLGEKRFLAVVEFQQQEFLVGGTGNSIALLARLDAPSVNPHGNEIRDDGL